MAKMLRVVHERLFKQFLVSVQTPSTLFDLRDQPVERLLRFREWLAGLRRKGKAAAQGCFTRGGIIGGGRLLGHRAGWPS
ncbi:MAG: hypothetical protein IPL75_17105 [Acidobacteria bacterium]|nr:hypothetical protein [Acidobacteriota bacterium]